MSSVGFLFLFFCVSVSAAFVSPKQEESDSKRYVKEKVVIRPELATGESFVDKSVSGIKVEVKRDRLSAVPRLISGVDLGGRFDKSLGRSHLDIMRRYVTHNRTMLGIGWRDLRLVPEAAFANGDVAFYKFDVFRHDLKVEDAGLFFRFKQGRLVQVVNRTFAEARIPNVGVDSISDRELRQIAERELGANNYRAAGYSYRVVAAGDNYELAKVRTFSQELGERDDVQIDVRSGKVYEVAPSLFFAEDGSEASVEGYAKARAYQRWYKEEPGFMPLAELAVNFVTNTGEETGGEETVSSVVTDSQGRYMIPQASTPRIDSYVGAKVKIFNQTGPAVSADGVKRGKLWETFVNKQGDDVAASHDKIVAQSMVFHHTDYIFRLAANYITTPWFDSPLSAHTNLASSCNAHWDGRVSTVNFYSGSKQCANTGLISDIVYHEWGHGLDAKTGGIADGAFSEGFGDTMSLLITRSNIIGMGFGLNGRVVRDLAPNKVHPQDARGGVHAVGLITGGTFWDLYQELKNYYSDDEAIDILRKYAFQMIFTAEKYTDAYDAVLVIDDDDADLSNGTPNFCAINESFAQHGLATFDRKCLIIEFVRSDMNEAHGNGNRVIEPGERIELTPWIENLTDRNLESLQGLASSDSEYLVWQNNAANWSSIAAGEKDKSDAPLVFTVKDDAVCGSKFEVNLDFEIAKKPKHFSESFLIGRLTGERSLYQGVGLPMEIPDLQIVEVEVLVDGEQWQENTEIYQAHLKFAINHSFMGDLNVSLIAPDDTEIEVEKFRGRGRGTMVFDKDITDLIRGHIGVGAWSLRVADTRARDVGTLQDFVLTLTPKKFACEGI